MADAQPELEQEADNDDAEKLAALQTELAVLRLKAKEGEKLSGKDKRNLKKLEAAEERWKEYAAVGAKTAESGGSGAIGSQFVASSDVGSRAPSGATSLGDGLEIPSFSIRAASTDLFVNARLSIKTGRKYGFFGPNGRGKSTLLAHVAGRALSNIPTSISILLVAQEVRFSSHIALGPPGPPRSTATLSSPAWHGSHHH
jgi:ATP-binding cassette subfamily F protein 1